MCIVLVQLRTMSGLLPAFLQLVYNHVRLNCLPLVHGLVGGVDVVQLESLGEDLTRVNFTLEDGV